MSLNCNITDNFRPPQNFSRGRGSTRGYGRGRRMPDYKVHPDKWTMYSLEDVDTSDSSNKQAALAFLDVSRYQCWSLVGIFISIVYEMVSYNYTLTLHKWFTHPCNAEFVKWTCRTLSMKTVQPVPWILG